MAAMLRYGTCVTQTVQTAHTEAFHFTLFAVLPLHRSRRGQIWGSGRFKVGKVRYVLQYSTLVVNLLVAHESGDPGHDGGARGLPVNGSRYRRAEPLHDLGLGVVSLPVGAVKSKREGYAAAAAAAAALKD